MKYENKKQVDEICSRLDDLNSILADINSWGNNTIIVSHSIKGEILSFERSTPLFGQHLEPMVDTIKTTIEDEIEKLEKELESL